MKYSIKSLFEYLEGKFDVIDGRFAFIEERFDKIDQKLEEHDQKFVDLTITVENIAVATNKNTDELKIVNSRLSNIEKWAKQAANVVGIKFKQ